MEHVDVSDEADDSNEADESEETDESEKIDGSGNEETEIESDVEKETDDLMMIGSISRTETQVFMLQSQETESEFEHTTRDWNHKNDEEVRKRVESVCSFKAHGTQQVQESFVINNWANGRSRILCH